MIKGTPGVGAAFRGLSRNYANYGTKTGTWLESNDPQQFLEVAGPNMPGPGQVILFRKDGIRLVETATAESTIKHRLTFDEYELVFGEHPSDIFDRRWRAQLMAQARWASMAQRDVRMTVFDVCYQTPSGGIANDTVTAVDRMAVQVWLSKFQNRVINIEPAEALE
jgi:hypothetical protein